MPYLRTGRSVREVTDEVRDAWPRLEQEAQRDAAAHGHSAAAIWFRTDEGGVGLMSARPAHLATFTDVGPATDPGLGVIVAAAIDRSGLGDLGERSPEEEPTDAELRDEVAAMRAERPDLDWDHLLMGRLAGPPTPDRPAVPVWEYLVYSEATGTDLARLTAARFPVRYLEGGASVSSVDEELKPPPASYRGRLPEARFALTAEVVVGRYAALHDAGVVDWDPVERGIVYLQPSGSWRHVVAAWAEGLPGSTEA